MAHALWSTVTAKLENSYLETYLAIGVAPTKGLVAYFANGYLRVRNLQGNILGTWKAHDTFGTISIAFSSDEEYIYSNGSDGLLKKWRLSDRSLIWSIPSPGSTMAVSPQDDLVAVTGAVTTLIDSATGAIQDTIVHSGGTGKGIAFSPGADWLCVTTQGGMLTVYNLVLGTIVYQQSFGTSTLSIPSFSGDGGRLVFTDWNSGVRARVFDTLTWTQLFATPYDSANSQGQAVFAQDSDHILCAGSIENLSQLTEWDLQSGLPIASFVKQHSEPYGMDVSRDGTKLYVQDKPSNVNVFDASSGALIERWGPFPGSKGALAANPASDTIAFGSNPVMVCRSTDGTELGRITKSALSMNFSPDGQYLALGVSDHIDIHRTSDLSFVKTISAGFDQVNAFAFSADGSKIVLGYYKNVYCVDVATGATLWTSQPSGNYFFYSFAFSNNGSYVCAGAGDRASVLRVSDGALVKSFTTGGWTHVLFSPESKFLYVSSSYNLRTFRMPDGKLLHLQDDEAPEAARMRASRDGTRLFLGRRDGVIVCWPRLGPLASHGFAAP
ncbi:MAG: WD40 repeat domain-containing protein [Armatimonadetes bacterium]|nr:WD40 repeat domain-containing protein [Armatimonadota bacterium]